MILFSINFLQDLIFVITVVIGFKPYGVVKCAKVCKHSEVILDTNIPSGRFVEAIPLLEEEVEGPGSSPVNRLKGHPYNM